MDIFCRIVPWSIIPSKMQQDLWKRLILQPWALVFMAISPMLQGLKKTLNPLDLFQSYQCLGKFLFQNHSMCIYPYSENVSLMSWSISYSGSVLRCFSYITIPVCQTQLHHYLRKRILHWLSYWVKNVSSPGSEKNKASEI